MSILRIEEDGRREFQTFRAGTFRPSERDSAPCWVFLAMAPPARDVCASHQLKHQPGLVGVGPEISAGPWPQEVQSQTQQTPGFNYGTKTGYFL